MRGRNFLLLSVSLHAFCFTVIIYLAIWLQLPIITVNEISSLKEEDASSDLMATTTVVEQTSSTTSIFFTGDLMLGRHVEYHLQTKGGDYAFRNLDFLKEKPAYVVGNFEASIPLVHKKTPNFNFLFSVDKKYLTFLQTTGFTHLSLANNHAEDYGKEGLLNTEHELSAAGLNFFGRPKEINASTTISLLTIKDKIVAVLGINTIFWQPQATEIKQLLTETALQSDYQIVYIHWGNEYEKTRSQRQYAMAKLLTDAGADLIIGHHPHVVQSVEIINNTMVFYSLGNLIFDQYFSNAVQQGLVLELVLENGNFVARLLPVTSIGSQAQPRLMDVEERFNFLQILSENSDLSLEKAINKGHIYLPSELATSSEMTMMKL